MTTCKVVCVTTESNESSTGAIWLCREIPQKSKGLRFAGVMAPVLRQAWIPYQQT